MSTIIKVLIKALRMDGCRHVKLSSVTGKVDVLMVKFTLDTVVFYIHYSMKTFLNYFNVEFYFKLKKKQIRNQ